MLHQQDDQREPHLSPTFALRSICQPEMTMPKILFVPCRYLLQLIIVNTIRAIQFNPTRSDPPRERPEQRRHVMHVGDGVHDPVPVARIAPSVEAIVDRCWPTVFAGQISPREAGAQDIKNAVDHATVIHPLLARVLLGKAALMNSHSNERITPSNRGIKHLGSVYKPYGFMVCFDQIRGINDHGLQAVSGMALGD